MLHFVKPYNHKPMIDLDFAHTCPIINQSQERFDSCLSDELDNLFSSAVDHDNLDDLREDVYNAVIELFSVESEELRSTNSAMRSRAEEQLTELDDELQTVIDERDQLLDSIEEMRVRIDELQSAQSKV